MLDIKAGVPRSVPGTHMVEREQTPANCSLALHTCVVQAVYSQVNVNIFKN